MGGDATAGCAGLDGLRQRNGAHAARQFMQIQQSDGVCQTLDQLIVSDVCGEFHFFKSSVLSSLI
jgi:hypothetical protein